MEHPVFINPFTDFGFKKIFGDEANKDLLIDFLNELLAFEGEKIANLTYKKNEKLGLTGIDRNVVFDLYCENEKGEKFTVELQKAKQSFFKDRMLYYSSFSIQEQGQKGKSKDKNGKIKDWNYELKAVYVIGILDFIINEAQKEKIVESHNKLMDIKRNIVFYDKLTFVTLQMPNFDKTIDQLENNFDKWLYVIKNLKNLDRIPEALQEKIFQKVFNIAKYAAMNKSEREAYEDSLKYYRDLKNSLDTAEEEGWKRAESQFAPIIEQKDKELQQKDIELEAEKQKAVAERQKAEAERQKAELEKQKLLETIKFLKELNIDDEIIAMKTGMNIKEIKNIR